MIKYFRIQGRVQGVSYRANTRDKARGLAVSGWVRNCDDGSVEVLASGEVGAIDALEAWLKTGPRFAVVRDVKSREVDATDPSCALWLAELVDGEFSVAY